MKICLKKILIIIITITFIHKLYGNQFQKVHDKIHYYLACPENCNTLTVVFQGSQAESGCPLFNSFKEPILKINSALLVIEKPGILEDKIDLNKYVKENNITKRLEDAIAIINLCLSNNKINNLLIMGGSEGSVVASMVANAFKDKTKALVLFATGSLSENFESEVIKSFSELFYKNLRIVPYKMINFFVKKYLQYRFNKIKADPTATNKTFLGQYSYVWWDQMLKADTLKVIKSFEFPVLVSYGEKDDPTSSNKIVEDQLKSIGKNLTFKVYPDLDHGFVDSKGISHKQRVIEDAVNWLASV